MNWTRDLIPGTDLPYSFGTEIPTLRAVYIAVLAIALGVVGIWVLISLDMHLL